MKESLRFWILVIGIYLEFVILDLEFFIVYLSSVIIPSAFGARMVAIKK